MCSNRSDVAKTALYGSTAEVDSTGDGKSENPILDTLLLLLCKTDIVWAVTEDPVPPPIA